MKRIFGVDGNWFLHRAAHVQNYESVDPQAALCRRFVSMIANDALRAKAKHILVAFDGNRVFRYKLYKRYKANRGHSEGDSSPYDYLGGLMEYLAECGIHTVQLSAYEADDLLCSLASQAPADTTVVIGTRDKDAFQYAKPNVQYIDSSAKPEPKVLRYEDIEGYFGVHPKMCLDYQTLVGDGVDNIPAILKPKVALTGLKKHGSLKQWLAADPDFKDQLREFKDQLNVNRKLVKLVDDIQIEAKTPVWNTSQEMTRAYINWKTFCNPSSRGLF